MPPAAPESHVIVERCCELHPPTTCGQTQCPACGALGKPVKRLTLGALLKPEARPRIPVQEEFCFCRSAHCDVVYFRKDEALFRTDDVAVPVHQKRSDDPSSPVCYCFGWTPQRMRAEIAATGKSTAIDRIKAQVKASNCYCEVTNPQGSCCLGNAAQVLQPLKDVTLR